ncbi:MAG TPA: hypothetical protein VK843_16220 [Planctomycetota bacterium]|nr:hypothetical protein [Planctomycetota bacterium]
MRHAEGVKTLVPRRSVLALICLASLGQVGCRTPGEGKVAEGKAPPSDLVVTVRRQPDAKLFSHDLTEVSSDGSVSFNGYERDAIGTETVEKIWTEIERATFFQLEDEYRVKASHITSTIITVRANGVRKTVLVTPRTPEYFKLDRLATSIEEQALTRGLLKWR